MDVDPLADTVPPRHAIESDEEEDEYNPLLEKSRSDESVQLSITIEGKLPQRKRHLVVATREAASYWSKGAKLGEQVASAFVNRVQVGLLFSPSWSEAAVLISEVTTRLPAWAMHEYAKTVIDTLRPSTVALLDTYPVPAYISSGPVESYDAPVRYLGCPASFAKPFDPPNLIQSTSAAFLSILALTPATASSTLILLPSLHISPPPPRTVERSDFGSLENDSPFWPRETMTAIHEFIFPAVTGAHWEYTGKLESNVRSPAAKRSNVGDGGMYI